MRQHLSALVQAGNPLGPNLRRYRNSSLRTYHSAIRLQKAVPMQYGRVTTGERIVDRARAYEARTLAILFVTLGATMLDRMTQIFLGPNLVRDLHLTNVQIGIMAAALSMGWGISAFVFGFVSDRVGRKAVLIPAVIAFSFLSALSGRARTYEELLLVRTLLGLAEGPCWSAILALMDASSAPERRGRNLGIVNSAGTLVGSAIAPIFATQIAARFGWRAAFFAAGIPGLICALLIALLIQEPPRAAARSRNGLAGLAAVIKNRDIWLCLVGAFLMACWVFGFSVFAPLYVTQVMGLPVTTSGFLMGASGLGGFAASLLWPTLSDRIGRRPALIFSASAAAVLPLAFLWPYLHNNYWLLVSAAFLFTAGPAAMALTMVIIPVELVGRAFAATAIGLVSIGADLFGATLGPIVGGRLADHFGLIAPMLMASACAALLVVVGLAVRETAPGMESNEARARAGVEC